MAEWATKYDLHSCAGYYWNGSALAVPDPDSVSKALLEIYHNGPTTGHPGQAKTYLDLQCHYWWPGMHDFIKEYIRGCAICQENKIITRHNKPHLYPIPPEEDAKPFQTIAIDLIVKLPELVLGKFGLCLKLISEIGVTLGSPMGDTVMVPLNTVPL